jgi:hypothetical protein
MLRKKFLALEERRSDRTVQNIPYVALRNLHSSSDIRIIKTRRNGGGGVVACRGMKRIV